MSADDSLHSHELTGRPARGPRRRHREHHFMGSAILRDIVIGMADGLTVPFALAAGLSGATGSNRLVVVGGLAEIVAGAIAMGLGGYLAARTDAAHYRAEYRRERREIDDMPGEERREVAKILREQGLNAEDAEKVVDHLSQDADKWVQFMMRFELGLDEPDPSQAPVSAGVIGGSYVAGGIIPLLPYILMDTTRPALMVSIGCTLSALFIFGFIKGRLTGMRPVLEAVQTTLIGGAAAAAAYGIAHLVSRIGG